MSFSTLILNLLSNVIFLGMILLTYKTEMLFSISHPPYCIVPRIARCWRPTFCFCHLFTIAWIFFDNQQQSLWLTVPKEKKWLHKFGNIEEMTISLLKLTPEIKCKICSEHFTWLCFSDSVRSFSSILSILFHIVDWNFSLRLLTLPFWFINTKIVH